MGVFEWLRRALRSPATSLLEELKPAYTLAETEAPEPLMGTWWQCAIGGWTVAFKDMAGLLGMFIGEVDECADPYLVRVPEPDDLPDEDSPQRLDRIVGAEGIAVAQQWVLGIFPEDDEIEYPQLRLASVREGLVHFSPAVAEVLFSQRGIELLMQAKVATLDTIAADLRLALRMVEALAR